MSAFHQSKQWRKVSKDFKTLRCIDCGKTEDIESGHILPASRFKMTRLWKSNLVPQCRSCNAKLGDKIRWSLQAIKLLSIYIMIRFIEFISLAIIIIILSRYIYLDVTFNNSTITNQIRADLINYRQQVLLHYRPQLL